MRRLAVCVSLCVGCLGRIDPGAQTGSSTGGGEGGGPAWEVFVSNHCTSIAADETDFYLGCFDDVERVSKHGDAAVPIVTQQNDKYAIAVDHEHVYWAGIDRVRQRGDIVRMPKGGGPVEVVVADQDSPASIQLDDRDVYWLVGRTSLGRLMARPKAGGAARVVYDSGVDWFGLDGDSILLIDSSAPSARVLRIPKEGGAPVTVANAPARMTYAYGGMALALGFAAYYGPPRDLIQLDLSGGTQRVVTSVDRSSQVGTDGGSFFFATAGQRGTAIRAWNAGGEAVRTVAETTFIDDDFIAIFPTATRVYWMSRWWPHGAPEIRHVIRSVPRGD